LLIDRRYVLGEAYKPRWKKRRTLPRKSMGIGQLFKVWNRQSALRRYRLTSQ
jgi:hypothetical protein